MKHPFLLFIHTLDQTYIKYTNKKKSTCDFNAKNRNENNSGEKKVGHIGIYLSIVQIQTYTKIYIYTYHTYEYDLLYFFTFVALFV